MDAKQVPSADIESFETIDFKRIFGLLRRNFWLLAAGLVLSAGAVVGYRPLAVVELLTWAQPRLPPIVQIVPLM